MRNPHDRPRTRTVRRVRCCHGSDCPTGPHKLRQSRCFILTRVDYADGRPSEGWLSGDYQETIGRACRRRWAENGEAWAADWAETPSERVQRKRHTFDPSKPLVYGGGFWERGILEGTGWPPCWTEKGRR